MNTKFKMLAASTATVLGLGFMALPAAACWGCTGGNQPVLPQLPAIGVSIGGDNAGVGLAEALGNKTRASVWKDSALNLEAGISGQTDGCVGGCGTVNAWFAGDAFEKVGTSAGAKSVGRELSSASVENASAAMIRLNAGFNRSAGDN